MGVHITAAEAHVWWGSIGDTAEFGLYLDPTERAQFASVHIEAARRRMAGSRSGLRQLLAHYLGIAPLDISFDRTCRHCGDATHGKPRLANEPALSFNMSHAGEAWCCVITSDREVGVDIEKLDQTRAWSRLADRIRTPA